MKYRMPRKIYETCTDEQLGIAPPKGWYVVRNLGELGRTIVRGPFDFRWQAEDEADRLECDAQK